VNSPQGVPVAVIDSSAALNWVLPEPGSERSLALLDAREAGDLALIAPRVFMEEAACALTKRCRSKELTLGQAQEAFRLLERRKPLLTDESGLLQSAFALALRRQLSLWDCLYLALAIERQCNLITGDRRFYRSASKLYPFIELL